MRECSHPTTCHMSHVTYYVSHVRCHVSCVTCHMQFFFLCFVFGQSCEAYWWRVCYQRGLPRLVYLYSQILVLFLLNLKNTQHITRYKGHFINQNFLLKEDVLFQTQFNFFLIYLITLRIHYYIYFITLRIKYLKSFCINIAFLN